MKKKFNLIKMRKVNLKVGNQFIWKLLRIISIGEIDK